MMSPVLRIRRGTRVSIRHRGIDLDCRLLLMGDLYRQVTRAYEEIVYRFAHEPDTGRLVRSLASSGEIRQFYDIRLEGERVSVLLRDEVFRPRGTPDDLDLVLTVASGSRRVDESISLDRLRTLGTMLPLLLGDHPAAVVESRLEALLGPEEAGWGAGLLRRLRDTGLLTEGAPRSPGFPPPAGEARVTFLGHSALLFQSRRSAVVADPVLAPDGGQPERVREMVRIPLGAICCSHSHWDHCHPPTLLWFDKQVPVLIPRIRRPTAFNPPIAPLLDRLGFKDIREVEPWAPIRVDDIEVLPVPFHGEQDEPGAEVDHFTYVLRSGTFSVYSAVDSFRDTFGDMEPVLRDVRERCAPGVAFLPVSEMRFHYRHGGVNAFCRYLDRELLSESFQYTASAVEAARWAAVLGARRVVPAAEFAFSRWVPRRNTLRFGAELEAAGLGDRFHPMRPLDALEPADLRSRRRDAWRRWRNRLGLRVGEAADGLDGRLQRRRWYRLLRRGLRR